MKKILILFLLFLMVYSLSNAQKTDCDMKLDILKKVFTTYEIKHYADEKVFETKVWDTHATIEFKNCYVINFEQGIKALAFNIYLSDDPKEYQYMAEEGIYNKTDVDETTDFQGGGQRLIQVLFYDLKNGKFIGKPKGFPIDKLSWIPEGMDDLTEINEIRSFKKNDASKNTCILTIDECPDCLGGLHYVFKLNGSEILTSKAFDGCFDSICEKNNKLIVKLISNCYEVEYDGMKAEIEEDVLFQW